jgi:DNA-binding LacI/PurR family transcriptional regulator
MGGSSNRAMRLAEQLRLSIKAGEYSVAAAMPSERSLTQSSGLSRTTVRRALQILEQEGFVERVSGSGTYVRGFASSPATQSMLGFVVPNLVNPYYGQMADAIALHSKAQNYQFLVGRSNYASSGEANHIFQFAENSAVKGVLVVPSWQEPPLDAYHHLDRKKIPYVFISRQQEGIAGDAVIPDREQGAMEVVQHLITLGHRKIAYIRGVPPQIDFHYLGYLRALQGAGIPIDQELIVSIESAQEDAGREGMRQLLARNVPFTAVFARNDLTAIGVLQELSRAGLAVPDRVSLVGFDNTPIGTHLQPMLTTVNTSVEEISRLALLLLLDRIEGRYSGPPRQVVIRTELIIRDSTASLRA